MEARFGQDLGAVRVHTGAAAAEATAALGADAVTVGSEWLGCTQMTPEDVLASSARVSGWR